MLFLCTDSEKVKIQGVQNQTLQDSIYKSDSFRTHHSRLLLLLLLHELIIEVFSLLEKVLWPIQSPIRCVKGDISPDKAAGA